ENNTQRQLGSFPVILSHVPTRIQNVAIKVREGLLGSAPGKYRLTLQIGTRFLAEFPIQIVSQSGVLSSVKVSAVSVVITSRAKQTIQNPHSILLCEQETVHLEVELRIGILAPNLLTDGALVFRLDDT